MSRNPTISTAPAETHQTSGMFLGWSSISAMLTAKTAQMAKWLAGIYSFPGATYDLSL